MPLSCEGREELPKSEPCSYHNELKSRGELRSFFQSVGFSIILKTEHETFIVAHPY